jgi:hypothetical protein
MIAQRNTYHGEIVNDYVSFIGALQQISSTMNIDVAVYDLYESKNKMLSKLKEVRLHDFYIKNQHSFIAGEIYKEISEEFPGILLVPEKKWEDGKFNEVFVGSGFTNGKGISEVKYVVDIKNDKPVILGIQIQGDQFRLFVETREDAKEIAELFFNLNVWFDFSKVKQIKSFGRIEYPISPNKYFNTYSGTFMYRSVKLRECSLKDLIEMVAYYIGHIHEERENLRSLIRSIL